MKIFFVLARILLLVSLATMFFTTTDAGGACRNVPSMKN
jgi:hypothetical protein